MYFTDREKGAILHLTAQMAAADGRIAENEKTLAKAIAIQIGDNGNGARIAQSMSSMDALSVVSAMAPDEKRFVCAALGSMIAIDGDVDNREMLMWGLISDRCRFPEMNIMQAADIFQSYL